MKLESITPKIQDAKEFIAKHIVVIFIFSTVAIFSFMVVRIYFLSVAEPSTSQVEEKLSTFKTVRLDEKVVTLFRSLEDRDISVESLFNNGRTNPFQ